MADTDEKNKPLPQDIIEAMEQALDDDEDRPPKMIESNWPLVALAIFLVFLVGLITVMAIPLAGPNVTPPAVEADCPPSGSEGTVMELRFENNSSQPVEVWFMEANGTDTREGSIEPGGKARVNTFTGASYCIRDLGGHNLQAVTAETNQQTVQITD